MVLRYVTVARACRVTGPPPGRWQLSAANRPPGTLWSRRLVARRRGTPKHVEAMLEFAVPPEGEIDDVPHVRRTLAR